MERSDFNEETSCHFLLSDLVKKKKPHWIDVKKIKEGRKIPLKISELAMGHVKMNMEFCKWQQECLQCKPY